MPDEQTFKLNAQERLEDARVLFAQGRYHGATYICGYAIEFALKARICETLDVDDYPEKYRDFKVHDLKQLLELSGRQKFILTDSARAKLWNKATSGWKPEMRYQASGNFTLDVAKTLIDAVSKLLPIL